MTEPTSDTLPSSPSSQELRGQRTVRGKRTLIGALVGFLVSSAVFAGLAILKYRLAAKTGQPDFTFDWFGMGVFFMLLSSPLISGHLNNAAKALMALRTGVLPTKKSE